MRHTGFEFVHPGNSPGPLAFSDKDYLASLISGVGFNNLNIDTVTTTIDTDDTPEIDAKLMMDIGFAARILREADQGKIDYEEVRKSFVENSKKKQTNGIISYKATIFLVNAKSN